MRRNELCREIVGGEPYEYYTLGRYVVKAPGVCGGRPTFKYTRIEVKVVLDLIAAGVPLHELTENLQGRVSPEAIAEAMELSPLFSSSEANVAAT